MQAGRLYSLKDTLKWSGKYIIRFIILDSVVFALYYFLELEWFQLPWQPMSLIGIAVAFYLGFKNNSAYDRMWEARKIWGGIVNTSRSFTVMVREFVNNDERNKNHSDGELVELKKTIVYRHIAWLHALALQLRKPKPWEHNDKKSQAIRKVFNTITTDESFEKLKPYLSSEEYDYIMSKGNHASHLLSVQTKKLMDLRRDGTIEHFRHLELQSLITEMYTLEGKAERIKNFPFPRQYATVNFYFVMLFIILLPFGMIDVFEKSILSIWFVVPFSVVGSWVFWMMEMIGDHSENPFEGLYNDVPISTMARGIEIDIRQMLDEVDLPEPEPQYTSMQISV